MNLSSLAGMSLCHTACIALFLSLLSTAAVAAEPPSAEPEPSPSVQKPASSRHWSFVAPERPALPQVKDPGWVRTAIDYFILARLEHEGVSPAAEASRTTLLRRLSLDLTGLPP